MAKSIMKITDRLCQLEERVQELEERVNTDFDDMISSVLDSALKEMRTRAKDVIDEAMNDVQKT